MLLLVCWLKETGESRKRSGISFSCTEKAIKSNNRNISSFTNWPDAPNANCALLLLDFLRDQNMSFELVTVFEESRPTSDKGR